MKTKKRPEHCSCSLKNTDIGRWYTTRSIPSTRQHFQQLLSTKIHLNGSFVEPSGSRGMVKSTAIITLSKSGYLEVTGCEPQKANRPKTHRTQVRRMLKPRTEGAVGRKQLSSRTALGQCAPLSPPRALDLPNNRSRSSWSHTMYVRSLPPTAPRTMAKPKAGTTVLVFYPAIRLLSRLWRTPKAACGWGVMASKIRHKQRELSVSDMASLNERSG